MSHLIKSDTKIWKVGSKIFKSIDTITTIEESVISGFDIPTGIALDVSNDRYYVCNWAHGTVRIMKYSDNTQIALVTGFNRAAGIALDVSNDRYYVSNYGTNTVRIMKYSDNTQIALVTGVS